MSSQLKEIKPATYLVPKEGGMRVPGLIIAKFETHEFEGKKRKLCVHRKGATRAIAKEMPDAYKNVDDVVLAVEEAGLASRAVRLKPHLVIKG